MLVNSLDENKVNELNLKLTLYEKIIQRQSDEIQTLSSELHEVKGIAKEAQAFNPCGFLVFDRSFVIHEINVQTTVLLGREANGLVGKSFLNFLSENSAAKLMRCVEVFLEEKYSRKYELEIFSAKGIKYVQLQFILCRKQLIHGYLFDVTKEKLHELKLMELEKSVNSLNSIYQNISSAIALLDKDFYLQTLNQAFAMAFSRIFSCRIKVNDNLMRVLADFPELKNKVVAACSQAARGHRNFILVENKTHKADAYYCYEFHFFLPDKSTHKNEIIFKISDLSHARLKDYQDGKQRAEIERVSRFNLIGELTSALAHEINQPLTAIKAYTRSCLKKVKDSEEHPLEFPLKQIERQAEHAGEIIHKMRNFKEGVLYLEQTNINYLIRKTIGFLYHDLARLKFNFNFLSNIPSTMVDRVKIMQVILNLGRNSIEALKGADVENPEITLATHLTNDHIVVYFQDNGPGIPPEIQDKILHSYFTTKPQGTGLGLSICRTIIMAHGGVLSVHKVAQGACFVFTLPVT
ncbi:PAS domain-containing sensor histidine kinase [Legionella taurinensis]|nr:ATP-binding protein [Legionella taurinensis]MDX1838368.1 ATP-binding protein [Legionella taurinensis]STY25401.1 signal transduction histidine kinase [Legionella taurinensis]